MDRIRVLVADDNNLMREIIIDSLAEDEQIEVVGSAADGTEAIELIREHRPDVVLLDLVMPKTDGIGVMEAIREDGSFEKYPHFIIISAAGKEDIVSQALMTGAEYFFMKPFEGSALVKKIKQMMIGIQPINPAVTMQNEMTPEEKETDLENMVTNLLRSLGVPIKMVGYKYLRDAIILSIRDTEALLSVTKFVYPQIAETHGTSAGNVERNIRYVIESTWQRKEDPKYVMKIAQVFHNITKKPTNSEFILVCSEWINYHMN